MPTSGFKPLLSESHYFCTIICSATKPVEMILVTCFCVVAMRSSEKIRKLLPSLIFSLCFLRYFKVYGQTQSFDYHPCPQLLEYAGRKIHIRVPDFLNLLLQSWGLRFLSVPCINAVSLGKQGLSMGNPPSQRPPSCGFVLCVHHC